MGDNMLVFFKGFIIGLGKIIPGVSGSLLAIRLNVYEKMINSINCFFKDFKYNFFFLSTLGFGMLLAIIFGSNIISYFLDNYYIPTLIIFIILILSGIPSIIKEVKNYLFAVISFLIYLAIVFIPELNIGQNYFFMGFLEAFTTIIPGISGTALFMSFGIYDELLSLFSNLLMFEFNKLIPFGIGLIIGALILVRFIDCCFKNHRDKTYSVILGLLLASIVVMLIKR